MHIPARLTRSIAAFLVFAALAAGLLASPSDNAWALDASPFDKILGRWVGEGRLGVRNSATEQVKCRVTYLRSGSADALQQTIRCASGSGSIEVRSTVIHAGGALTGTWTELSRSMEGELTGNVTPRGFRVHIKGESLTANMDIVVLGTKQVIEIQFIKSSLIGLTLILDKG